MANTYIKLNGMYTAAVENEKSTIGFLKEHFDKEKKLTRQQAERAISETEEWFKQTDNRIGSHTVNIDSKTQLIVSRVTK